MLINAHKKYKEIDLILWDLRPTPLSYSNFTLKTVRSLYNVNDNLDKRYIVTNLQNLIYFPFNKYSWENVCQRVVADWIRRKTSLIPPGHLWLERHNMKFGYIIYWKKTRLEERCRRTTMHMFLPWAQCCYSYFKSEYVYIVLNSIFEKRTCILNSELPVESRLKTFDFLT